MEEEWIVYTPNDVDVYQLEEMENVEIDAMWGKRRLTHTVPYTLYITIIASKYCQHHYN